MRKNSIFNDGIGLGDFLKKILIPAVIGVCAAIMTKIATFRFSEVIEECVKKITLKKD